MKFIDYNGSGGLDPQDIATSIAVEEAASEDAPAEKPTPENLSDNAGCAVMTAFIVFPILMLIAAI